jgi:iron-sulfur cluster repair protein YtfE (RIC family)
MTQPLTKLDGHMRREERELFPLIERVMPEPELVELTSKLGS